MSEWKKQHQKDIGNLSTICARSARVDSISLDKEHPAGWRPHRTLLDAATHPDHCSVMVIEAPISIPFDTTEKFHDHSCWQREGTDNTRCEDRHEEARRFG